MEAMFQVWYYLFILKYPLAEAKRLFDEGKTKEAKGKLTIPLVESFIIGNILGSS